MSVQNILFGNRTAKGPITMGRTIRLERYLKTTEMSNKPTK